MAAMTIIMTMMIITPLSIRRTLSWSVGGFPIRSSSSGINSAKMHDMCSRKLLLIAIMQVLKVSILLCYHISLVKDTQMPNSFLQTYTIFTVH